MRSCAGYSAGVGYAGALSECLVFFTYPYYANLVVDAPGACLEWHGFWTPIKAPRIEITGAEARMRRP